MRSQGFSIHQVLIAIIAPGLFVPNIHAQSLARVRQKVQHSSGSSPSRNRVKSSGGRRSDYGGTADSVCDDDDNPFEELLGYAFLAAASAPFVVPRVALDDNGETGYFADYPYDHDGGVKNVAYEPNLAGLHRSTFVIQGSFGQDFNDLSNAQGRIFGDYRSRWGIDSEFYYRHENTRGGNDELWNGDFNLTYRFAQNENWQFRAGVGVNWLTDEFDSDAGINSTYSVEWFPGDPYVLTGLIDWGRIGDTSLFHFRTTAGITHNGWGTFTGYDVTRISDETIHAWINGIEYRF